MLTWVLLFLQHLLCDGSPEVIARMYPTEVMTTRSDITSWVKLTTYNATYVNISWDLHGFPSNAEHALHIHEYGDITDNVEGMSTGGHFNPNGGEHECYPNYRHAGDLIAAVPTGSEGESSGWRLRDLVSLTGADSALGRSIVMHEYKDDCGPNNGNAGGRISQGVLGTVQGNSEASAAAVQDPEVLVAVLKDTSAAGREIQGKVFLRMMDDGALRIYVTVEGLDPSRPNVAFHAHEYGDIATEDDGMATGGHFNPDDTHTHGLPAEAIHHAGDFGNLQVKTDGTVAQLLEFADFSVNFGLNLQDLLGLALVIHQDEDQGMAEAEDNGNAGPRIVAGVIGYTGEEFPDTSSLLDFSWEYFGVFCAVMAFGCCLRHIKQHPPRKAAKDAKPKTQAGPAPSPAYKALNA